MPACARIMDAMDAREPTAAPGRAASKPPPAAADYPGAELLRSRRLRLRGFQPCDLADLLRLGQEPRVGQLLLDRPLSTLAEVCGFIDWINRFYRQRPGLGIWRAGDRSDTFLGFFSLMPEETTGEISLGARLLPRAWGRGYALEGGAALCEHAFATLRLPLLIGLCDPRNRPVPPLLARLGFEPDGQMLQDGKPALRFVLRRAHWNGIRRRPRPRPCHDA